MTTHNLAELIAIMIGALTLSGAMVALGRFLWRAGGAMSSLQKDVKELRRMVEVNTVQVTNHIPTQLVELKMQVAAVKDRLELHEEREERHWKLLTRVIGTTHGQETSGTGQAS
jgi:hypothetical protein